MMFETILSVLSLLACISQNNADVSVNMLEDLAAHVKVLEEKLTKVEVKLETVQMELDEQKRINLIQEEEISAQWSLIESLRTLSSTFKVKVGKMERKRKTAQHLKSDEVFTREHLSDKKSIIRDLGDKSEKNIRVYRQETEKVAFSAFLSRDISNLGPGHTIQYGATHLNEGNAFNAHTGIFMVPVDGVYLFSFACEDYHNHRIYANILVDGQRVSLVLEGPSGVSHAMGTNVVILRLTKGQSVWVAIDAGGHDDILQNTATTFSGVFLYY